MFELVRVAVTTTGSAGSATGNEDTEYAVNGKLYAVYLDYHASAPGATTDVTITQTEAPSQTLLTVTDNATDGWYFPREAVCGNTGTGLTYDGTRTVNEAPPVVGYLTVAVAQSNALTNCVVAYLYIGS
jgi:hypothetical protein